MRTLPFLLIVALGCSQPPQLRLVDIGSDEFVNPMPFALRIENSGVPVLFDEIVGECRTILIVSPDTSAKAPKGATMRVALTDRSKPGHVTLAEGDVLMLQDETEVWGVLGWELPGDSPPLLGFFEARFTLRNDGADVFAMPAYAFAMQSREGVFEEIVAEVSEDLEDSRALLKVIDGMEGTRSACLKELRDLPKASLPPAA
jgi:hypothetical protein